MGNWTNRDTKLKQRQLDKNFSKPFRRFQEKKNKKEERQRIREAQRRKYYSMEEDNDNSYE